MMFRCGTTKRSTSRQAAGGQRRHLRHHVCAGRARHRPHYRLSRRQHSLPSPPVAYHTSRGSSGRPTSGGPRATQPMRPHEKPHDNNLVVSQTFQSLLLCYYNTIQYNTKFVKRHVAVASEALANRSVRKQRRRRTNVL